jgi:hypothetical protein
MSLSKYDIAKMFMRKAADEVSPSEQRALNTILEEIIGRTFDFRKGSKLANILMVKSRAETDEKTVLAVLKKFVKCAIEVEKEAQKYWNGHDAE